MSFTYYENLSTLLYRKTDKGLEISVKGKQSLDTKKQLNTLSCVGLFVVWFGSIGIFVAMGVTDVDAMLYGFLLGLLLGVAVYHYDDTTVQMQFTDRGLVWGRSTYSWDEIGPFEFWGTETYGRRSTDVISFDHKLQTIKIARVENDLGHNTVIGLNRLAQDARSKPYDGIKVGLIDDLNHHGS